jgi:hypothetical protein
MRQVEIFPRELANVRSIEALQHFLRRLCEHAVPSEDAVLLHRFVAANEREAFKLLLARHGPMVLGTARRLVDNSHDAEDVFQAAFLSLARLTKTIRQGRTLPAWLHKTTCQIANVAVTTARAGAHGTPTPRWNGHVGDPAQQRSVSPLFQARSLRRAGWRSDRFVLWCPFVAGRWLTARPCGRRQVGGDLRQRR